MMSHVSIYVNLGLLVIALSSFIPLIYSNYNSIKQLPGQIGFVLMLNVPVLLFAILCFFQVSLFRIILPYSLVIVAIILILHDFSSSKGSTAAIGLYIIPVAELVLLILGFIIGLFF